MNTSRIYLSVLSLLFTGCVRSPHPSLSPPAESTTSQQMNSSEILILDEPDLVSCLSDSGAVVLVRIETASVRHAGTRGEQTDFEASVKQIIKGSLDIGASTTFTRYTNGGKTLLEEGKSYIITLTQSTRFSPRFALGAFVPVASGKE